MSTDGQAAVGAQAATRWVCLYLEEHEKATLEDVELLVSNLRSLATRKGRSSLDVWAPIGHSRGDCAGTNPYSYTASSRGARI
jgi:hypothetical protein